MQAAGMTARWQQAFCGHGFEKGAVLSLKNGAVWLTTGRPYQEIPVWPKGENLPHEVETAVLCDAIFGQGMPGRDSRAYLTRPSVTQGTDEK